MSPTIPRTIHRDITQNIGNLIIAIHTRIARARNRSSRASAASSAGAGTDLFAGALAIPITVDPYLHGVNNGRT